MTEEDFWNLIDLLDWSMEGNDEGVVKPLVEALSQRSKEEICEFEEELSQKLFQLDDEAYAVKRGFFGRKKKGYTSADGFLYSRCVVIANGNEFFKEVIRNPKQFPHDLEFEMLLVVSNLAFIKKTGETLDYSSRVSYETFSNKEGWKQIHNN